jgi:DNA relaxase NicK
MRFSGPRARIEEATNLMAEYFGQAEGSKGRFFLDSGRKWGSAGLFFDASDDQAQHCVIEIPGASLQLLTPPDRQALCHSILSLGFKSTRFDVAVDCRGSGIGLVDDLIRSCKRGELCGARLWEPREKHGAPGLVAFGVCIGQRGSDGSGRYVRAYDKGLETKSAPAGEWVRWEVEFSDQCANDVANAYTIGPLAELPGDEVAEVAIMRRALGAVEFREVTGARMLSRRPLVAWWSAFIAGVETLRVKAARFLASAAGWTGWTKKAVWPQLLAYSQKVGVDVRDFVSACCGSVEPSTKAPQSQVGRELISEVRDILYGRGVKPCPS